MFSLSASITLRKCSTWAGEQWEKGKAQSWCQTRDVELICSISPCKFVFCPLRLWLSICQNTVVVWGQEGWHKADLRHFYVHLKHLIREMRAARVWRLSNQILLLPENAADCYKDGQSVTCSQLVLSVICWSLERCPSGILFVLLDSLLFALELIPLVQLLCCRIPSVGPSIWTLYILFPLIFWNGSK